jgi:hypothetical protein
VSGGHFELEDTITTHIIKIISFVDSKLKILGVHSKFKGPLAWNTLNRELSAIGDIFF